MAKSRKNKSKSNLMKNIKKTTNKALPVVNKGLTNVGTSAKKAAEASIPIIEKGVGAVYGTMATGLDLGVKGAKSVSKSISKRNRSASRSRSRFLALAGKRGTKRHRRY
jgi:hypothetical protein